MNQNKTKAFRNIAVTLFIAAIVGFTSCEKYIWAPPVFVPIDTTVAFDTVFYSTDVAPLFVTNKCTNCHPSFKDPDLSVENSFAALTTGGYVNVGDPPNSLIVTKIEAGHMGGMPSGDITLILKWIGQGAKNFIKQK